MSTILLIVKDWGGYLEGKPSYFVSRRACIYSYNIYYELLDGPRRRSNVSNESLLTCIDVSQVGPTYGHSLYNSDNHLYFCCW